MATKSPPIPTDNDPLLTAREAAEFSSLSEWTIRRLSWERKLRSFKVVGCLRFLKSDIENLIVERPATSKKAVT